MYLSGTVDTVNSYLIDSHTEGTGKLVITNLRDDIIYEGRHITSYFMDDNTKSLIMANVELSGNYNDVFRSTGSQYNPYNVVISKLNTGLGTTGVYYKSDVLTGKINAEILNKKLADNKDGIPSGIYLPWYNDAEGKPHLKMDAAETEKYVIP